MNYQVEKRAHTHAKEKDIRKNVHEKFNQILIKRLHFGCHLSSLTGKRSYYDEFSRSKVFTKRMKGVSKPGRFHYITSNGVCLFFILFSLYSNALFFQYDFLCRIASFVLQSTGSHTNTLIMSFTVHSLHCH